MAPWLVAALKNIEDEAARRREVSRAPEDVLRDARKNHHIYKANIVSGSLKPALRHVGLSRFQYGDGEFAASVESMQRYQEPRAPTPPPPEMETPVQITRTLSRTMNPGAPWNRTSFAARQRRDPGDQSGTSKDRNRDEDADQGDENNEAGDQEDKEEEEEEEEDAASDNEAGRGQFARYGSAPNASCFMSRRSTSHSYSGLPGAASSSHQVSFASPRAGTPSGASGRPDSSPASVLRSCMRPAGTSPAPRPEESHPRVEPQIETGVEASHAPTSRSASSNLAGDSDSICGGGAVLSISASQISLFPPHRVSLKGGSLLSGVLVDGGSTERVDQMLKSLRKYKRADTDSSLTPSGFLGYRDSVPGEAGSSSNSGGGNSSVRPGVAAGSIARPASAASDFVRRRATSSSLQDTTMLPGGMAIAAAADEPVSILVPLDLDRARITYDPRRSRMGDDRSETGDGSIESVMSPFVFSPTVPPPLFPPRPPSLSGGASPVLSPTGATGATRTRRSLRASSEMSLAYSSLSAPPVISPTGSGPQLRPTPGGATSPVVGVLSSPGRQSGLGRGHQPRNALEVSRVHTPLSGWSSRSESRLNRTQQSPVSSNSFANALAMQQAALVSSLRESVNVVN